MKHIVLSLLVISSASLPLTASFELESTAYDWVRRNAYDQQTNEYNLTHEQTALLVQALFYSYRFMKLDELCHARNRITVFFHKVLPKTLAQEHDMSLSQKTVAAFITFMNESAEDINNAYMDAAQQFEAAQQALERSDNEQIINAYNEVKYLIYDATEVWARGEGSKLSQEALQNLNEEQAKNLLNVMLNHSIHAEHVATLISSIPLKNLESFFEFQTQAHTLMKSLWTTHLLVLIDCAESAGHKNIRNLISEDPTTRQIS